MTVKSERAKAGWAARSAAICALFGMALSSTQADARNRITEMMVSDIASNAGVSFETAYNRADVELADDMEILPGLISSVGGVYYSYGGRSTAISGLRLYNETDVTICVRANAAVVGGAMVGSRQGGSLGYTFLIEPGGSEFVIVNTSNVRIGRDETIAAYASRLYFWLAGPASMEKRCSAIAPDDLESFMREPLPPRNQVAPKASPELLERLLG